MTCPFHGPDTGETTPCCIHWTPSTVKLTEFQLLELLLAMARGSVWLNDDASSPHHTALRGLIALGMLEPVDIDGECVITAAGRERVRWACGRGPL